MSLQIKSTFFTETVGISQTDSQAFGPNGSTTIDKEKNFRVSSSFTASGAKKAFAVCKGRAFVQPQTGSTTKVNLILQPIDQPSNRLPIKYFVYRGLDYASFFHSQNTSGGDKQLITNENLTKASDFVKRVWADFKAFNSLPPNTTEPILAKWIGFDAVNQNSDKLIDSFYYKISSDDLENTSQTEKIFELPVVEEGYWIGNFNGDFSLDIVLSEGDFPIAGSGFKFDLVYARAASWTFDTDPLPTGISEKPYRENILQFIDPAAFWGLHATTDGKLTVKNNENQPTVQTPEQVYSNVVNQFYTKNNLYLYIQSDRTRSYNFYNNYLIDTSTPPNSLKWGVATQSLSSKAYLTYKWPLIIESAPQNHNNPQNEIYLQLVTDNNRDTMLYGQTGDIQNAVRNNFSDSTALLFNPSENSVFTKEIILTNTSTGSAGQKKHIATLHYLIYQGKKYEYIEEEFLNEEDETVYVYAQPNYFDDIFDITTSSTPFETVSPVSYYASVFPKLKLISQYPSENFQAISAVQTIQIFDSIETDDESTPTLERVTYITEAVDVLDNPTSALDIIAPETVLSTAISEQSIARKTFTLLMPYYYDIVLFTDNTKAVSGIVLRKTDNKTPNKILVGLTKNENDLLKVIQTEENLINPRIVLVDLFKGHEEFTSIENISYQKYKAAVIGEDSIGNLKLFYPDTEIFIYSTDKNYHFSKGYSDYMKEEIPTSLSLDLSL